MNKEINLFVFNWQKYHIDLNTLSVLKSGSKSKCWHLRLSDVGGHHDADFGTLTRLLTKNTCHRIPKIMEQFWLKDIVCDIAPWNDSCNNLSLISPLIHIQINIYTLWSMYFMRIADPWFQSLSRSWSLVGSRERDRRKGRQARLVRWGIESYQMVEQAKETPVFYLLVQLVMREKPEGFRLQTIVHEPLDKRY